MIKFIYFICFSLLELYNIYCHFYSDSYLLKDVIGFCLWKKYEVESWLEILLIVLAAINQLDLSLLDFG